MSLKSIPISQDPTASQFSPERLAQSLRYERIPLERLVLPAMLFPRPEKTGTNNPDGPALAYPLVVAANANGSFTILDGCKRYVSLRRANASDCSCGILNGPVTDGQAGFVRIMLNSGRPLHISEQYHFFNWMVTSNPPWNPEEASKILRLPWKTITELKGLVGYPADVVTAVCTEKIHLQNSGDFSLLPEDARIRFLEFFEGLELSVQTQREFLQWLPEIAAQRNCSLQQIAALPECEVVRNDTKRNGPQKIQAIRSVFHSLRFPRFDADLRRWNGLWNKLNPNPAAINLVPDPFFEKDRLEIRVAVSDPKMAREIFGSLANISVDAWKNLMHPTERPAT